MKCQNLCLTCLRIITAKGELNDMKNPGTAAVLSLFIPGVGQIYNGAIWRGIFWLIITPGFWIGTGGMLGWVCHLIAAWTAYNYAQKHQQWAGAK